MRRPKLYTCDQCGAPLPDKGYRFQITRPGRVVVEGRACSPDCVVTVSVRIREALDALEASDPRNA